MNQFSLHTDEDRDSLFGSPPPSPARGRSPSQETFTTGEEMGPIVAVASTGVGRKNVGTIALPGSHMSCAELPANLPASSLSLPYSTLSRDSSSTAPSNITGTPTSLHTPTMLSRSSTRSVPSRASSAVSSIPSTSASSKKRRASKVKSVAPAPFVPPITLPGPNEPAPPNLLRSQSSLLGLAGLVGSVKPARLYTLGSQPVPVQQPRSRSPTRGSTPAHPIVLDDDQDTRHIGKHNDQPQTPQGLDQLNPEMLRSNIISSLAKEKNIFPVLESLIKLLSVEPHPPCANPSPQPFTRPYGHGIFDVQPYPPVAPLSTPGGPTTLSILPPKRRKLKHVPAGAVDWDVPFPFAADEGPQEYRDTWARERAKQLVIQLLELVQNATKKAAIRTAKTGGKTSGGRISTQNSRSSRSVSVETQLGQINSTETIVRESSSCTSPGPENAATGKPIDSFGRFVNSFETLATPAPGSEDRMSVESEGAVGAGGSAVPYDHSAFEEWLSKLQQFVPLETNVPTPESGWGPCPSAPLNSAASSPAPEVLASLQHDVLIAPHTIRDEVIDPALLAMSQQAGSGSQSQSPTSPISTLALGDIAQMLDISSTPPVHSPRTSLSSLTEPLTPLAEAISGVPTTVMIHEDPVRGPPTPQPVEKEDRSLLAGRDQVRALSSSPTEFSRPPRITAAQKGKGRAEACVASPVPSASDRSVVNTISTPKGVLDKRAILERARERQRQLVAEIERAKVEIWETSIENAVLVHFTKDGSL